MAASAEPKAPSSQPGLLQAQQHVPLQQADAAEHPLKTEAEDAENDAQLEENLLFLLADLANGDAGIRHGRIRPGNEASSSGGSSDTRSKLFGGIEPVLAARRAQRAATVQHRSRLRQQGRADDDLLEDEEATEGEEGDEEFDAEQHLDPHDPQGSLGLRRSRSAGTPGGEGGEGEGARPAKRLKPLKPPVALGPRKYVSSQITVAILEQEGCFNMTQVDAARHLGFGSSTVLKKVMRRLGIKQWPYRKRTSAKKITHSLEEYMRRYGDPNKVEAVLERVRMELAVYEASPTGSIPLRPELAALRQRLYKLDNKVKHEFKRDAEAPLRQCVQSLVEKTWAELQPSWVAHLAAQQPAAPQQASGQPPPPTMPAPLPPAAATAPSAGAGSAPPTGDGGAVNDTTLMLAMLLAQGIPVPPFMLPAMTGEQAVAAGGGAGGGQDTAAAEPTQQQEQQAALTPEEAEALAKARVAALAPDPPAQLKQEPRSSTPPPQAPAATVTPPAQEAIALAQP